MNAVSKNNDLDSFQDSYGHSSTNNIFLSPTSGKSPLLLQENRLNKNSETNEDYNIYSSSRNSLPKCLHKSKTILPPISQRNQNKSYPKKKEKKIRKDFYGNKIKKGGLHKVSFLDDANSLKDHMSQLRYNFTQDETFNNNSKKNNTYKKNRENEFIQIIQVECFKKLNKKNSFVVKNCQIPSQTNTNCQCCCIS